MSSLINHSHHPHLFEADSPKAMQHFHRCKTTSSPALFQSTASNQAQLIDIVESTIDSKLIPVTTTEKPQAVVPSCSTAPSFSEEWRHFIECDLVNATSQSIIFENVTLKDCLDIITDFERYPEFLDGYFVANVHRKETKQDYTVTFKSSFMFSTVEYTLQVKVISPEHIQFNSSSSNCLINCESSFKKHGGQWILKDLKNGNIQATYFVNMEYPSLAGSSLCQQQSGIHVKAGVCSNMKEWLGKKYVPSLLESFKKRIEEYGIRRKTQFGYNSELKRHLSNQLCL
ncbi:predicted protein [Naegleria gruberi]|uniref:Predicted protein n=1 Tax=Naegleria gruberi TaxID=5762 RepID=D2VZL4_NAEGR|nr:uncharacterized protein NAEGRDRAFT_74530 [Naegleria gruberi]EFC37721.1 predicted protein [Naegleria gruberi]|eukprot:XP_002670465.1 predicted protein [Naegleria gruberi strain NEG-M]